jgi:hypothetical protein
LTIFSTNALYAYAGTWSAHTLPDVGTAASPQAVGWNSQGTRALIVGRAIGPGLSATVIDHRPGVASAFSASDLVDQSIPNFDQPPWNGHSAMFLRGVDFRPSTSCAEGLIVGSDNGDVLTPTYGTVIRFSDGAVADCE